MEVSAALPKERVSSYDFLGGSVRAWQARVAPAASMSDCWWHIRRLDDWGLV